ncbi:MAG: nucleotidyltransferase domain-containing protein [Proteobacteria bacterium]|nr:nucleotidyltransferase domain-containing protein [Pseudomonadota bacterium]MBU1687904.1 nucleotidyltransferase domain-containing protein [Pseudomonadota bacterium]
MITKKEQVFSVIRDHQQEIYNRFNVEYLAVFGSVVRGTAGPDSDVDILVAYKKTPGFFEFLHLKKRLLSRICGWILVPVNCQVHDTRRFSAHQMT